MLTGTQRIKSNKDCTGNFELVDLFYYLSPNAAANEPNLAPKVIKMVVLNSTDHELLNANKKNNLVINKLFLLLNS